ncbi:MAG: M20/M25/M40 family metallo-hydrolase [Candidatus Aminicenantes bacterium]|nr:MAG: M20/M25/M40 family metallo-hydrolase [Candidatus Aminicenantes bacterium]
MNRFKAIMCLLVILIVTTGALPEKADPNVSIGLDSIQPHDVYDYCKTMTLPKYAGRLTGHEGYTAAAKWAAEKFEQWGLLPLNQREGYLQTYPSPHTIIDEAEMVLISTQEDKETILTPEKDFLPLLFSDSGENTAEIVFVGWGISAPELSYDDYDGMDVQGKFVLCFRGTPDRTESRFQKHDHHRFRMNKAKEKGALGLFYIYPAPLANPNGDWIQGFTPAIISENIADKILKEKGLKSQDLKKELLANKKPMSFPLKSRMKFRVRSENFPDSPGYNVVGYVEGSDSLLKKECLVIGGHFDHCGEHMGMVFPGANDNASGSAVVMEIAEAFSRLNKNPKRSVVFVLFGGEEMGLQGSTYFANHLPSQFDLVDGMFNFDMVGEGDGVRCAVAGKPDELKQALQDTDISLNILKGVSVVRRVGVRSSDYAPFFQKGAACVSFFSNGPHLNYHLSGDTIYRINPDIMADIARLAFLSGYTWSNRQPTPPHPNVKVN